MVRIAEGAILTTNRLRQRGRGLFAILPRADRPGLQRRDVLRTGVWRVGQPKIVGVVQSEF